MNELLAQHNIYTIKAGDFFGLPAESCYLVYAPLSDSFFLARKSNIETLAEELKQGKNLDNETWKILLRTPENLQEFIEKPSADNLLTLYLILNERCNFACKYCYSALGRSKDELSMATIRPMVEKVIANAKRLHKRPYIMFIGGGEPTLSWDTVKETVAYATQLWQGEELPIRLGLSTNGSILTDEMIAFYQKHSMEVQFSFEVLPDVQNSQRGSFDKVSANLIRLSKAGINVRIRSTITQLNVNRMDEMVKLCQQHYPTIRGLVCEPVTDPMFMTSPEIAQQFFNSYYESFMKARELAKTTNLPFASSCARSISAIKNHFCGDMYCVTPFGTITSCPHTSSPREQGYEQQIYGRVEDGVCVLDKAKYHKLIKNGDEFNECGQCFARWNCAGGCPTQRRAYPQDVLTCICDNTRRMLKQLLMERLEERYQDTTGNDFCTAMREALSK